MFRIALILLLAGCMKQTPPADAGLPTTEVVGKVDFQVKSAGVHLYEQVLLGNGQPFMVSSINYDRANSLAYLSGFPVDPTKPDMFYSYSVNCSLAKPLTNSEMLAIQSEFESIQLCRVSSPAGTAVPLVFIMTNGSVTSWDDQTHYSPLRYSDGVIDICSYTDLARAGRKILSRMDLSQPLTCQPIEVSE